MDGLAIAFDILTSTPAVFAALAGVAWGIVGGALPGISPSIALALLLPFTYGMDPTTAIILLGATYVGAEYGGSIPAILINTPGTNAAAATVIDGYYMHREGRGGEALGISLQSGVIGGMIGITFLILFTEPLSRVALAFNFPAYFALGILGLSVIVSMSNGSLIKGMMTATLGLMISTIGTDPMSGVTRFTFGQPELLTGVEYVIVMVGVFAISELMMTANTPDWGKSDASQTRIKLPSFRQWRKLWKAQGIGSGIGIFEGVMPGAGGSIAAFMSYNEARRWSNEPEKFGKGSEEGIAAPEAANNAVACTALVPVLSFGIPGSNSAAILMGGMLIHGLTPGPMLFQKEPEFVYGLFGGLVVANISQLLLGILMMTPALWLVNRPKPYLMAAIFALVFSGIYSIHDNTYDLYLVLIFGVVGYLLRVFGFPFLPLVLGLVLGYLIEFELSAIARTDGRRPSHFLGYADFVLASGDSRRFRHGVRHPRRARRAQGDTQGGRGALRMSVVLSVRPCRPEARPAAEEQLSWAIAQLAAGRRPVDPQATDLVGCRLIDNAAIAIASLDRSPVATARAQALCFPRKGGARIIGLPGDIRSDCTWAAFANATAVRELDFHDSYFALDSSHPADCIMTLLAVAQQCGSSGDDLVRGILVSYEVQTALVRGLPLQHHRIDHVAHLGPAVAAGLGAMLKLDVPVIYEAVNLAAHMSLSTRQIRKGRISSWKASAPGHIGKCAIEAVDRAIRGETAPSPIYEGDYGILAVLLGGQEAEVTLPGPGEPCRAILDTLPKAHSAGYHGQAIIDLALRLHGKLPDLDRVEAITIHTKRMTHMVMGSGSGDPDKWDPKASRETLDHSAPFQFARALVDGFWHHDRSYEPSLIADPDFVRLWGKVRTVEDEEWNRRFNAAHPIDKDHGGRAVIRFADGREVVGELAVADSHPRGASPWRYDDYRRKFETLTEDIVSTEEGESFLAAARRLTELSRSEVRDIGLAADLRPPVEGPKGLLDRTSE